VIEEKFYDVPMDSDKLLALMECMDDKLIEYMTPQYVNFLFKFLKENGEKKILLFIFMITDY
jgi:hypothetical protein